ncbi:MAG: hypothetical protein QM756_35565 [Polyangiaceae bacterium]
MVRAGTLMLENEALAAAAVVAAHATLGAEGFRQRDVRFFIELFSNWLEATTGAWTLDLHNAQVQRHLDWLVQTGWAKRPRRKPPRYALTAEGLLKLLAQLSERKHLKRIDEFFLIVHILSAYGERLRGLVQLSGPLPSKSLSVDLDELLDVKRLVARERALVEREVARLVIRIEESRETSRLARELLRQGQPVDDVIAAIEARFPYELNSRKPLSELFSQLPAPFRRVELETIAEQRAEHLWEPTRRWLLGYDEILASLVSAR